MSIIMYHCFMIKKMQREDIDEVMKIWLDTNISAHTFISDQYWKDHYREVKQAISEALVYVYKIDDKIVGFIGMIEDHIAGIFIRSDYQSQGIGKSLLAHVKKIYDHLTLEVYAQNKKAIAFYMREGFKITDEIDDPDTGEVAILMTLV